MAETLVEKTKTQKSAYGITSETQRAAREKLERLIREQNAKVFTEEDFDFPKDEKTQTKIRAEVDEFMRMREEWREEDRKLERGID